MTEQRTAGGTVLLVTPPPTPNGPLHVGHLSGPYVAGDIAARALRARGRRVVTQCGLDSHQNYVLTRAEARRETAHGTAAHYGALVREALRAARVDYDIMADPLAGNGYRAAVAALLDELVEAGVTPVRGVTFGACGACGRTLHHARVAGACSTCGAGASGGTCEGCGTFLTAMTLVGARSTCCEAAPRPFERDVPVFRLEDHRERLSLFWSRAVLPPRLRRLIASYLDAELPEIPLAYPSEWGIEWRDDLRIDVWAEMAVANLYLPAHHLDPGAHTLKECIAAWDGIDEHWIFLGIDNAFYYAVLIPAMHLAAGVPSGPTGLVVNEFYRLTGQKFSTSRNHAIWAHEFLATEDPGLVRAFVSWDRPDGYESDFTPAAFEAFRTVYAQAMSGRGPDTGAALADIELTRGELALALPSFDPAAAVRAAIAGAAARPERAARLLALVAGENAAPTGGGNLGMAGVGNPGAAAGEAGMGAGERPGVRAGAVEGDAGE